MKTKKPTLLTTLAIAPWGGGTAPGREPAASGRHFRALLCLMLFLLAPAFAKISAAADITVKGRVFYNDNRTVGHFDRRFAPDGKVGKEGDRKVPNWLAAYRWTVDIIELDKSEPEGSRGCTKSQLLTTVEVEADGAFLATIKAKDACKYNIPQILDLQVRVKMHNCFNDWCISFRDADGEIYAMDLGGATYARPHPAAAGQTVDLGDHYYPARDGTNNAATINGVASNYWASVVDGAIFLHEEREIPFFEEEFGPLSYYYPSSESDTATAWSPQKIAISAYAFEDLKPAWTSGWMPVHEYGHILMQRAWGGGYGFPGAGRSANSFERASSPSPQVAFKEAWAEFVGKVVFAEDRGCEEEDFDLNNSETFDLIEDPKKKDSLLLLTDGRRKELSDMEEPEQEAEGFPHFGPILAPWLQGVEYRYNNLKFLCDFHDSTPMSNNVRESSPGAPRTPGKAGKPRGRELRQPQGPVRLPRGEDRKSPFSEPHQYPSTEFEEDRVKVGFVKMWEILRGMYLRHMEYGGEFVDPGLYVCDWADYYVNLIHSEEAVGKEAHDEVFQRVLSLTWLNNLTCGGVFGTAPTPVR